VPARTSELSTPTLMIAGCPATSGIPFSVTEYPAASNVWVVLVRACPVHAAVPAGQLAAKSENAVAEQIRERRRKHAMLMVNNADDMISETFSNNQVIIAFSDF